jgi:hypothetical protein
VRGDAERLDSKIVSSEPKAPLRYNREEHSDAEAAVEEEEEAVGEEVAAAADGEMDS